MDPFKAEANSVKHGVSFAEAETVFQDPFARIVTDEWHSTGEEGDQIYGSSLRRRREQGPPRHHGSPACAGVTMWEAVRRLLVAKGDLSHPKTKPRIS